MIAPPKPAAAVIAPKDPCAIRLAVEEARTQLAKLGVAVLPV